MGKFLDFDGLTHYAGKVREKLAGKQDMLTGQPGQAVGFNAGGKAAAVRGWSNPNLLLNWDFRAPVNRNGETAYTQSGYTIDQLYNRTNRTKVAIVNHGLKFEAIGTGGNRFISQQLASHEQLLGKSVTISFLLREIQGAGKIRIRLNASDGIGLNTKELLATPYASQPGLYAATGVLPASIDYSTLNVSFLISEDAAVGNFAVVEAWKLELGSCQTLAHQEAGGKWIINDPVNYALQYALCSQYSQTAAEFVGSRYSNPNLLDNWYFANPVNQRGQNVYTEAGYTIDRWYNRDCSSVSFGENGITFTTTKDGETSGVSGFNQRLEFPESLFGKVVTISMLVEENTYSSCTFQLCRANSASAHSNGIVYTNIPGKTGLIVATGKMAGNLGDYTGVNFGCYFGNAPGTMTIKAAKLELGPVQTLAHREGDEWVLNDPPPNMQQELAKCQRYFYTAEHINAGGLALGTADSQASVSVPLPVNLRAVPSTIDYGVYSCVQNGKAVEVTNVSPSDTNGNPLCLQVAREDAWELGAVNVLFTHITVDADL